MANDNVLTGANGLDCAGPNETAHPANEPNVIHKKPRRLPSYNSLPRIPNMPHGCAWGLWDTPGHRDDLGTLNLLTPDVIRAARDEIQLGISVAINWSLDNCATPHSYRKPPEHRIKPLPDWTGHDDEISMNTQSGSQWDGFSMFP